ncbi:Apoptotic ATPase [Handroanthus impetiginosus]|uniref:Apoptotic ATPase n=1 Tax=Handroanthus impetiginosus TaxID=429701 RepID=A0A2G9HCG2_9LAMI|nr:Apoptotic ATPase [Handroanthus impetiginosus]
MGGIGKTTLAKALYNKLIVYFKMRSFISSVREESQKPNGLESLQGKLLASLNSNVQQNIHDTRRGTMYIKEIKHNDPILLVLDDVDNLNQLDVLAGGRGWFHGGSRIIITSRDKEVLRNDIVDEIYEIKELTLPESIQLFSYHAFGREQPTENFKKITEEIVSLTSGLPLALEVFGSFLFYKRRIKEWHDAREKLKQVHPSQLQDILEISYNSLDDQERCVFLDLACFFVNMEMKREDAIDIFKGCGFNAETIITDLTAKSLVKIIDQNVLWMHDQLRDMGREIVRRENYVDVGQRSRLWDRNEILKVLKNEKGTRSIQGITLDFEKKHKTSEKSHTIISHARSQFAFGIEYLKKIYNGYIGQGEENDDEILYTKAFKPMINLRVLRINYAKLDGNFKLMPAELKLLQWKGCPLEALPFEFQPHDLAVLDLSESKISQLWSQRWWDLNGKKACKKLLVLNLSACHNLEEIPDLSGPCLEKLILKHCSALVKIHRSIGDMSKLTYLNLEGCYNLVEFPNDVSGLKCLEKLVLSGCKRLRDLPEDMSGLKSLRELLLDHTAIVTLPISIFHLKNLEVLDCADCQSLTSLPNSIGNLMSLRELSIDGSAVKEIPETIGQLANLENLSLRWCKSLASLPHSIGDLKSLTELSLNFASIKNLPETIGSLCNLKLLSMSHCANMCHLPDSIGKLSSLVSLDLGDTPINEIPYQVGALSALETLDMMNCQSLGCLPDSVGNLLNLSRLVLNGLLISELPESIGLLERLVTLKLNHCKNLQRLPTSICSLKSLHFLYVAGSGVRDLPADIGMLSNLRILKMRKEADLGQTEDIVLPASFSDLCMLEELDAHACKISGEISDDFEKLSSLRSLDLGYSSIRSLPSSLRGLSALEKLVLHHCTELKSLPPLPNNLFVLNVANCSALEHISDLANLGSLQELELTNCEKVIDIPGLEHLKSLRRLYTGGCNACISSLKRRLSKVALRNINYLCVPGSEIPNWFIQEIPNLSCPRNRELKGVIIGIVVSVDPQAQDGFRNKLPAIPDIQAKIIRNDPVFRFTTALYLRGVPNTDKDQLYLCRFHDYDNLTFMLQEGDMLQVKTQENPYFNGIMLKKHGIYLVFENEDDFEECDEALFNDGAQQSVSKRLSDFFNSL